jgi:hypothetical protein
MAHFVHKSHTLNHNIYLLLWHHIKPDSLTVAFGGLSWRSPGVRSSCWYFSIEATHSAGQLRISSILGNLSIYEAEPTLSILKGKFMFMWYLLT